jgi:hypothetical protein
MKFLSIFLSLFATVAWAQNVDTLVVSEKTDTIPVSEIQMPQELETQETVVPSPEMVFGYFSYDEALRSMPEYKNVKNNLDNLSKQFKAEADRSEAEFNKKYEAFLDEQRDLAPSILKKRQAELQDMLERNIAFKDEAQRLLSEAEQEGYAPRALDRAVGGHPDCGVCECDRILCLRASRLDVGTEVHPLQICQGDAEGGG